MRTRPQPPRRARYFRTGASRDPSSRPSSSPQAPSSCGSSSPSSPTQQAAPGPASSPGGRPPPMTTPPQTKTLRPSYGFSYLSHGAPSSCGSSYPACPCPHRPRRRAPSSRPSSPRSPPRSPPPGRPPPLATLVGDFPFDEPSPRRKAPSSGTFAYRTPVPDPIGVLANSPCLSRSTDVNAQREYPWGSFGGLSLRTLGRGSKKGEREGKRGCCRIRFIHRVRKIMCSYKSC